MNLSRVRTILAVLLAILLVVLALFVGGGWYYAGEIEERAFKVRHEPAVFDLRVVSLADGRVTLEIPDGGAANDWWGQPGIWGLKSPNAYHQVGAIVHASGDSVVREFFALGPPPGIGQHVRIDRDAYPGDPLVAHGIEFQEVGVPRCLGNLPGLADRRRVRGVGRLRARAGSRPARVPADPAALRRAEPSDPGHHLPQRRGPSVE